MKVLEEHRHWLSDEAHEVIAAVCPMQLMTLYQSPQRGQLFVGERKGGSGVRYTPGRRSTLSGDHSREQGRCGRNDNVRAHHVIKARKQRVCVGRERQKAEAKARGKSRGREESTGVESLGAERHHRSLTIVPLCTIGHLKRLWLVWAGQRRVRSEQREWPRAS
jgi:hypothetical protein